MLRAAAYARYSSDNQREESIDAQLRAISEFTQHNHYTIVKTYTDEALTATTDNRPQFMQMIEDAKKGLFDCVICHKLDRFARNRYDSAVYKKILKDHGVKFISVLENFDDSPESIILESVLEGMAEYYSANLAREVMKGLKENALQCKHTGGKPPFGYDVVNKKYVINESEAVAVRQIFSMVCSGSTIGSIVNWLEANNYRTKYNTKFTSGSINAIIRNEKYKGIYVYGKMKRIHKNGKMKNIAGDDILKIENGVPSIIDNDTWNKANEIYNSRQHKAGGQAKAKELYLLSGLIYCGLCGSSMCGNKVKSGRSKLLRVTYKCNTRKAKKDCSAKDIRKDMIEQIVIDEVDRLLSEESIDDLIEYFQVKLKEMSKELPDEIKALKNNLNAIEKRIDSLISAIMDGVYSPTIKERLSAVELEKQDLVNRLKFYEQCNRISNSPDKTFITNLIAKDRGIKNKSPEEQKRIIRTYVKKVIVYPDHVDIISEVDTRSGAEPYRFVSTYYYKQLINTGPIYKFAYTKIA